MKRASGVLTVFFLLTVAAISLLDRGAQSSNTQAASVKKLRSGVHRSCGPSLTIVFRGLMVFHPDPEGQYFQVGILPAPEHEFRMEVLEKSPEGVSSFSVPLGQFGNAKPDLWSLEFASSTKQGISLYQNGPFDRKRAVGDERDFRWVVDLEGREFYNHQLATNTNQLDFILQLTSGEFYTKNKTLPWMRKKADRTFQYFGSVADEVATDVSLEDGDMVLRSGKSGTEIFRLNQKPDTTYEIVIENAFVGEHHMAASVNHFHYYYGLIAEPKAEWYDFRVVRSPVSSAADSANASFTFASYAATANHIGRSVPVTPDAACFPAAFGQTSLR